MEGPKSKHKEEPTNKARLQGEQMATFLGWWTKPINGVKWPIVVWCNGTFQLATSSQPLGDWWMTYDVY